MTIPESLRDFLARTPAEERVGRVLEEVTVATVRSRTYVYLKEACEKVGIPRIGTHALRRMVVDAYYRGGADIGSVAAQLGQSPQVALAYYRSATTADRERAVQRSGLGVPAAAPSSEKGGRVVELASRRIRR